MNILRMIMSAGVGLLVTSAFGSYICVLAVPLIPGNCIAVTPGVYNALVGAGFYTFYPAGTLVFGSVCYLLTGKWKAN